MTAVAPILALLSPLCFLGLLAWAVHRVTLERARRAPVTLCKPGDVAAAKGRRQ